ncbi:MAG TPA: hypothetical protein VII81_01420 [Terriglobales bacterium]
MAGGDHAQGAVEPLGRSVRLAAFLHFTIERVVERFEFAQTPKGPLGTTDDGGDSSRSPDAKHERQKYGAHQGALGFSGQPHRGKAGAHGDEHLRAKVPAGDDRGSHHHAEGGRGQFQSAREMVGSRRCFDIRHADANVASLEFSGETKA